MDLNWNLYGIPCELEYLHKKLIQNEPLNGQLENAKFYLKQHCDIDAQGYIFMYNGITIDHLEKRTPKELCMKNDDDIVAFLPFKFKNTIDIGITFSLLMMDQKGYLRVARVQFFATMEICLLKNKLGKELNIQGKFVLVHNGFMLGNDETLNGAEVIDDDKIAMVDLERDKDDRFPEKLLLLNATTRTPLNRNHENVIGKSVGVRIIHTLNPNNLSGHKNKKSAEYCKELIKRIEEEVFEDIKSLLFPYKNEYFRFKDTMDTFIALEPGYAHASDFLKDINQTLVKVAETIDKFVRPHIVSRVKDFKKTEEMYISKSSCGIINDDWPVSLHILPIFTNVKTEAFIYIGPQRDGKEGNDFPVVKLRSFTAKTSIQDLINSYRIYAKLPNYEITGLIFNNNFAHTTDLVRDVLGGMFENNYLIFSYREVRCIGDLDNMVDFIEGKEEKKIHKKKKKKAKDVRKDIKKNLEIPLEQSLESLSINTTEHKYNTEKVILEASLKEKIDLLRLNKSSLDELFDSKSKEMKDTLLNISQIEDQNCEKEKRITSIGLEIGDMEERVANLKGEKELMKSEMDFNLKNVQKLNIKKNKLENYIETEMKKTKEQENALKHDIKDLEQNIADLDNPQKCGKVETRYQDPWQKMLDFLTNSILEKESELECPVCLETATIPIYSCQESHIICSSCRPKLKECPECRVEYPDKDVMKRHRFAEKTVGEIERLKEERRKML